MMKLIECPRDAMQGLHDFVPTDQKVAYLNQLLKCGFDTIDFGSFVSPKAIPQMADTSKVLQQLNQEGNQTKLLAIVANERGAKDACTFDAINYLGFPFSLSETFQQRNTNASQMEAFTRILHIQELAKQHNKELVIYLSMGFGNPYGDEWNTEIVEQWVEKFSAIDISILALADTVGVAEPKSIKQLFSSLIPTYPAVEFGAHFHSTPTAWKEKIDAAIHGGCKRFDTTIKGIGGCPMAKDDLVGNIATENVLLYLEEEELELPAIKQNELAIAIQMAGKLFT